MPLISCVQVILASSAGISRLEQILVLSLLIVAATVQWILWVFRRRQGGIDPKTGKPGGTESEFVAALWFLAALAGALYVTSSAGSEAVG